MRIEHVAINTKDLEGMRNFYETYFEGVSNKKYRNPATGLETYFITFQDGARLELMWRPELKENENEYPCTGLTHLAFQAGTREDVDRLTERLVKEGYPLYSAPRVTGDGYYESCIGDPDGNRLEITEG
ncbi:VOC family protein [Anaerolentibacter hominis]|uniref:VOC family protein n=1 Tax=Anaerolentibacter hominis TaxID=3079009 RepID=UPI0031B81FB9